MKKYAILVLLLTLLVGCVHVEPKPEPQIEKEVPEPELIYETNLTEQIKTFSDKKIQNDIEGEAYLNIIGSGYGKIAFMYVDAQSDGPSALLEYDVSSMVFTKKAEVPSNKGVYTATFLNDHLIYATVAYPEPTQVGGMGDDAISYEIIAITGTEAKILEAGASNDGRVQLRLNNTKEHVYFMIGEVENAEITVKSINENLELEYQHTISDSVDSDTLLTMQGYQHFGYIHNNNLTIIGDEGVKLFDVPDYLILGSFYSNTALLLDKDATHRSYFVDYGSGNLDPNYAYPPNTRRSAMLAGDISVTKMGDDFQTIRLKGHEFEGTILNVPMFDEITVALSDYEFAVYKVTDAVYMSYYRMPHN